MRSWRERALDARRTRWWWSLGIPLGILAGALAAVWLRTSGDDALTLRRGARVDVGFLRRLDPPGPSAPTADAARFVVVVFGYTSCPDVCPTTLVALHHALEQLGPAAARVLPVFVTVDPARDTAARLSAYVRSFDPRIGSISDPELVAGTMRAFRARATRRLLAGGADYSVDHTAVLYVLDADRRVIAALPEASATLSADVVAVLAAGSGTGAATTR